MRLSVLSGAALLPNGFFVLGRPLSTRQVIGGWNPISSLSSGLDWTGRVPKLSTNPFNGIPMANANLGAPPTFPALPVVETNGVGDIDRPPGSSINSDSYLPLPEFKSQQVATIQDFGDAPVTTNTLPIIGSSRVPATATTTIDPNVLTTEFEDPSVVYVFYTIVDERISFDPENYRGYDFDWDTFRVPFEKAKPGFALYRSSKGKLYSFTNLVNGQCEGFWCSNDAKMVISTEGQWIKAVETKYPSVKSVGQILSDDKLYNAGKDNGLIWHPPTN